MSNVAQNIKVAQRRYQILQILGRAKEWVSVEYIHVMLKAPVWLNADGKTKKPIFECTLSATKADLKQLELKKQVEKIFVRHYDETRDTKPQGYHFRTVAYRITSKGKKEL